MKVCFMLMHVIPIPIYKKTGIQTFKYSLCHVLQTQNSNIDGFVLQSGCHKFFVHHQNIGLAWLGFGSNCLIYAVTNALVNVNTNKRKNKK